MECQIQAPTRIDAVIHDLGAPTMTARLDQLDQAVLRDQLAAPILATYRNTSIVGGRSNVPVVMMLKMMMLQKWFNLGDEAAEGMLRDRLSFRRFVGVADEVIDATSLVRFGARLIEHGLTAALFDQAGGGGPDRPRRHAGGRHDHGSAAGRDHRRRAGQHEAEGGDVHQEARPDVSRLQGPHHHRRQRPDHPGPTHLNSRE